MLYKSVRILRRVVQNPYLNIVVGIIFLYTGVAETVNEIKEFDETSDFKIGVHHGVILFALLHILKFLPELFEGIEKMEKAGTRIKSKGCE